MPVEFSFGELTGVFNKTKALGNDVVAQFICNTGDDGEHDPDASPDDRVRPSHAAFHGMIFELGTCPVPPLDYGCRCAIRYVARPDTPAADVIDETSDEEAITPEQATEKWLEENVDDWKKVAKAAKDSDDPVSTATDKAKDLDIPQARSVAEMIVDWLFAKARHAR